MTADAVGEHLLQQGHYSEAVEGCPAPSEFLSAAEKDIVKIP